MSADQRVVEIVEHRTGTVEASYTTTGWPDRQIDRLIGGILVKLDGDRYGVRERLIRGEVL